MGIFKEKYSKLSGVGPGQLIVTTTEKSYLGRNPKYGTLKVTGDNGTTHSTVSLKLKGASTYISLDQSTFTAGENGILKITGNSNAKKLALSVTGFTVTDTKINSNTAYPTWNPFGDNTAIPNDPGATGAYTFEIVGLFSGESAGAMLSDGAGTTKGFSVKATNATVEDYITLGTFSKGASISSFETSGTVEVTSTVPWEIADSYDSKWLTISPLSGSTSGTLQVSVAKNTGRNSRQSEIVASKYNDTSANKPTGRTSITQAGAELFVKFIDTSVQKLITDVETGEDFLLYKFRGETNGDIFRNLTFTTDGNSSAEFYSLSLYDKEFDTTSAFPTNPINLYELGDYGAAVSYGFELVVKVTPAVSATTTSGGLTLWVGNGGTSTSAAATFVASATGTEYLDVFVSGTKITDAGTLTIDASGAAKNISIQSNVDWEIVPEIETS